MPFAALAIAPTNRQRLSGSSGGDPEASRALALHWGRLHAVRAALGMLGSALALAAVQGWSVGA